MGLIEKNISKKIGYDKEFYMSLALILSLLTIFICIVKSNKK